MSACERVRVCVSRVPHKQSVALRRCRGVLLLWIGAFAHQPNRLVDAASTRCRSSTPLNARLGSPDVAISIRSEVIPCYINHETVARARSFAPIFLLSSFPRGVIAEIWNAMTCDGRHSRRHQTESENAVHPVEMGSSKNRRVRTSITT